MKMNFGELVRRRNVEEPACRHVPAGPLCRATTRFPDISDRTVLRLGPLAYIGSS